MADEDELDEGGDGGGSEGGSESGGGLEDGEDGADEDGSSDLPEVATGVLDFALRDVADESDSSEL